MISISETANEYLLTIPAKEKERAKGIRGRRWDMDRNVWTYDRTIDSYDALISEFADDVALFNITRPNEACITDEHQQTNLEAENFMLRDKVAELEKKLSKWEESKNTESEQTTFFRLEISRLNDTIAYLKDKNTNNPTTVFDFVNLAVAASNSNKELKSILERNVTTNGEFDSLLPIDLVSSLESHLRRALSKKESTDRLHDLLASAKEEDLLGADYIDLAHIIRKQRNLIAHG